MVEVRPTWLPIGEAAARLGVTARTLGRWASEGRLRCFVTPGGHRRFRPEDVEAFIAQHSTGGRENGESHDDSPVRALNDEDPAAASGR